MSLSLGQNSLKCFQAQLKWYNLRPQSSSCQSCRSNSCTPCCSTSNGLMILNIILFQFHLFKAKAHWRVLSRNDIRSLQFSFEDKIQKYKNEFLFVMSSLIILYKKAKEKERILWNFLVRNQCIKKLICLGFNWLFFLFLKKIRTVMTLPIVSNILRFKNYDKI